MNIKSKHRIYAASFGNVEPPFFGGPPKNPMTIADYIRNSVFRMPIQPFIYSPVRPNSFSTQGETMVEILLKVSPMFADKFDRVFPVDTQREVAQSNFVKERAIWKAKQNVPILKETEVALSAVDPSSKSKGKKYFETNRQFTRLVPCFYQRTKAPRISTKGSTLHGMKKDLLKSVLKDLSLRKKIEFLEIDMSACHSRVARSLILSPDSVLGVSLREPQFWATQVNALKIFYLERDLNVDDKTLKRILKVALYTAMNGGNPASDARLLDNLSNNYEPYAREFTSVEQLQMSPLWSATKEILNRFSLVAEVRNLNETCAVKEEDGSYKTYTPDRWEPYVVEGKHLGISRVLQGFEVVLLTVLVKQCLIQGSLPVSLDHDGVLIMVPSGTNTTELVEKLGSGDFAAWSEYLLKEPLPVEVKRHFIAGEMKEF